MHSKKFVVGWFGCIYSRMSRLIVISIAILVVLNHSVSAGTLYDVVVSNVAQFSMVLQAMKDAGFAELVQQKGTN